MQFVLNNGCKTVVVVVVVIVAVVIGSRPSDHYFRSVCLFVCLFLQSFSRP